MRRSAKQNLIRFQIIVSCGMPRSSLLTTRRGGILAALKIFVIAGAIGWAVGLGGVPSCGAAAVDFDSLPAKQRSVIHLRTDQEFWRLHPELNGSKLKRDSDLKLRQEYMRLREQMTANYVSSQQKPESKSKTPPATMPDPDNKWYGDVPPRPNKGGFEPEFDDGLPSRKREAGEVTRQGLETRATALAGEAQRLAREYENASPARMEQIRARFSQMYGEALQLQKDSSALGINGKGPLGSGGAPTGGLGLGAVSSTQPLPGTVTATGQIVPASSLSISSRDFFSKLANEQARMAEVRVKQAQIWSDDVQMAAEVKADGESRFNTAAARAGLDIFNGISRAAIAATAPPSVYETYEGVNAGTELVAKDFEYSFLDAELKWNSGNSVRPAPAGMHETLNDPRLMAPKDVKTLEGTPSKALDGVALEAEAAAKGNEHKLFGVFGDNKQKVAEAQRRMEEAVDYWGVPLHGADDLDGLHVPKKSGALDVAEEEANLWNQFGHLPDEASKPTRMSKVMKGVEVFDGALNSAKALENYEKGDTGAAIKNGVDVAGNVASYNQSVVGRRVVSATKGVIAAGEGVKNVNQSLDDKNNFQNSIDGRILDSNTKSDAAALRAQRNRELERFLRDLEKRADQDAQSTIPPSQGPNADYFPTKVN